MINFTMGNCYSDALQLKDTPRPPIKGGDMGKLNAPTKKPVYETVTSGDFFLKIKTNNRLASLIGSNSPYYFQLVNGSEFTIIMGNNGPTKCDVRLELDGEFVGLWRVEAQTILEIERPLGVKQKFIFKTEYPQFSQSNAVCQEGPMQSENGRIRLLFNPEVKKNIGQPSLTISTTETYYDVKLQGKGGYQHDLNAELYSGGTTILGGTSNQIFAHVTPITEIDADRVTEIKAWLVIQK